MGCLLHSHTKTQQTCSKQLHDIHVYVKQNYFYGSPHIQIVNGRGGANHVQTWSSI
jgi:hypothetical protein